MDVLRRCDRRMQRYMAGVRWQDRNSSSKELKCGIEDLSLKLRQRMPRWFGHVKMAKGGGGGVG